MGKSEKKLTTKTARDGRKNIRLSRPKHVGLSLRPPADARRRIPMGKSLMNISPFLSRARLWPKFGCYFVFYFLPSYPSPYLKNIAARQGISGMMDPSVRVSCPRLFSLTNGRFPFAYFIQWARLHAKFSDFSEELGRSNATAEVATLLNFPFFMRSGPQMNCSVFVSLATQWAIHPFG